MSVWVREEVLRWGLRFCSRRPRWQKCSFLVTASVKDPSFPRQQFIHLCGISKSQTCLSRRLVSSVRFYSQIPSQDLEGKEHLSSPLETSPTEIQFDAASSSQIRRTCLYVDKLKRCLSPSDVLDLTCQQAPTDGQISSTIIRMWSSIKKMSDEQRRSELELMFEHPAFNRLLQMAMTRLEHISDKNIPQILLAMVSLGVPQKSRVVQTYLRYSQENLNSFDEKSRSILVTCLEHMHDSENVVALRKGMRLIAEAHLPNIKTVMALQSTMRLFGKDAPLPLKKKLVSQALSMKDQFNGVNSQYMLSAMASAGFISKPMLYICTREIKEQLHGTPFGKLLLVLYSCKELRHRDTDLLTGISEHMASTISMWNSKQVTIILSAFEGLNFCPTALMDAFADQVIADAGELTLKALLCVLRVYSYMNHDLKHRRQQFLDSVTAAVESYQTKMSWSELLKAVYSLCLLGHFPPAPLQQLLQSTDLEKLDTEDAMFFTSYGNKLRTLDLCLRLECPGFPQHLTVPDSVLGDPSSIPSLRQENLVLSQDLQSLVKEREDTRLQEMVLVENLYRIDGLITGPEPGPTCDASSRPPAESSLRTAVIFAPVSSFCLGSSSLRGPAATKIRLLNILGYNTVLVTKNDLLIESEEERIDSLRRRIFPEHHTSESAETGALRTGSRPGS